MQPRLFPDVAFHDVLSLGADCEAANGLRLVDRHGTRGLFDWLVTPLDAVAAILADDGARLAERFVAVQDGTSARCDAYGVLYHHELPRDPENQIVFSSDLLADCRSKLRHKMESFRRACEDAEGPVLFLRVGPTTDLPWDRFASGGGLASDFDDLAHALGRRFPGLDFRLLVVTIAPASAAELGASTDPRVAFVDLPRRGEDGWRVAEDDWRSLFASLAFTRDDRGNGIIGETLYWFGIADREAPRVEAAPSSIDEGGERGPQQADLSAATVEELYASGAELLRIGQSFRAVACWETAFDRGHRDLSFLRDYLGLLTGETRYDEVLRTIDRLREEGVGSGLPSAQRHLAMLSGHAKLALSHPRDVEIAAAVSRAEGKAWLHPEALRASIAAAIEAQRPFAFIRLGDGEARFLLSQETRAGSVLNDEERHAMGDVVWENWFGDPLSSVSTAACSELTSAFVDAVASADVVGACTPERLAADTGHYGYLVWQERWLRQLFHDRADTLFADAQAHRHLNADMPFLAALLEGLDVLGIVSPHPGLADALGRKLRIGDVKSYVVPGEGRLPSAQAARASDKHFPDCYETLLASLAVPRPGCVFLVAAGLLGKIYCARIKALGGIALDVGALVDAWMGFDTRDGQYADVATLSQSPDPDEAQPIDAPTDPLTHGCVSFGKTGSMALADAVREAGFPDAVHLHYLGPRAIAIKRRDPEPMLDLAIDVSERIADPAHSFRFVTAIRDPIARILSQAFYRSKGHREVHGVDIVRDQQALITWWDASAATHPDIWTQWFDDTFKATFGFDFREHPFDHTRKSLRFASDRLRLLVLRQEDDWRPKEAELGWLLDREGVALRSVNDAAKQGYLAAYQVFLQSFVAPPAWLDAYYDNEVVKHFYTEAERDKFRTFWASPRNTRDDYPDSNKGLSGGAQASRRRREPLAPLRTVVCLSMMKTGSTALAAALEGAAVSGDVAHLHHLGPRARARLEPEGRPVEEIARRADDPSQCFTIVTCVREPLARWISQAFHNAPEVLARTGRDIVADGSAFVAWMEAKSQLDYTSEWFEDSLFTPFSFDFRAFTFEQARKSLRFETDRLRLLILRQEDAAESKETELGWLLGRNRVAVPRRNERAAGPQSDRYRLFCDSFVAPPSWLDAFYDDDVIKHFYTDDERDAFRARWSRR